MMSSQTKKITLDDIMGPAAYADVRDDVYKRIIELKKPRRIIIGNRVSMVFENRQTLIFQTEEMLKAESITDPEKIQDEIDVYNAIMPTESSLAATLFIELPRNIDTRVELGKLIGLDEHLILHIGDHHLRASFEQGRSDGERISAVQYVRFTLPAAAKAALLESGTPVSLEIDHPNYHHTAHCSEETRLSLAGDYSE